MCGVTWSSSCSRNAHAQKVLVRRAHLRIDQATPKRKRGIGKMHTLQDGLPAPSGEVDESRKRQCGEGLLGHDLEEFDLEH